MIGFANLPTRKKAYGGANGNKLSVVYDGELYMLKLLVGKYLLIGLHKVLIIYNILKH